MKKEELQTGTVLEFANGYRAMVIRSVYGDSIYYATHGCNEQDRLSILSDDLEHTTRFYPKYGRVMRILKANTGPASMRPDYMVKTCNEATEILWEREVYPKWFRSKIDGTLVKFTGLNEGIVVANGCVIHPVGYKCRIWVNHSNSQLWQEVQEPIKEMTVGEIEESLGFKIKIIKE